MKRILTATLTLLSLAACDLLTEPGPDRSGRVSFSIPGPDGQTAGTFNANGTISQDSLDNFTLGNWAFAQVPPYANSWIDVYASVPAGNGRFHLFEMGLPRNVATGTVLEARLVCYSETECAYTRLFSNLAYAAYDSGTGPACGAVEGTVQITARGNGRIKGSFSVTTLCFMDQGTTQFNHTVNDGSFDLPLIERTLPSTGG